MTVVAAVVVALPAVAAAEPAWQPAVALTQPGVTYATGWKVLTTSQGEVVAVWVQQRADNPFPLRLMSVAQHADGSTEPVRELDDDLAGCVLDIASDAAGNVIVSWERPNGSIRVARRPPGGEFGAPEMVRVSNNTGGSAPVVAMNAAGDAALFWVTFVPDGPYGDVVYEASFSRHGEPFGPIETLTAPVPAAFGGYDAALTPDGTLVAVWAGNPEHGGASYVRAVSRLPGGLATPVQTLAESSTYKTCPQVLGDAAGRVAALWHEVTSTQCASWGRDLIALRDGGAQFGVPAEVPGSAGIDAARGTLAVSDAGAIAVSYETANGGHMVTGSFDEPLVDHPGLDPAIAGGTLGGDAAGNLVAGRAMYDSSAQTQRVSAGGEVSAPQDVRPDCARLDYLDLAMGGGRAGALALRVNGDGSYVLDLVGDGPGAPSRHCRPASSSPQEPAASGPSGGTWTSTSWGHGAWSASGPGSSPTAAAPEPDAQTALGFRHRRPRITGHGGARRVLIEAGCGVPCRITGTVKVAGRHWHARHTLRARFGRAGKAVRFAVTFRVPARGRGRALHVSVRLVADDGHGNRAVRSARATRKR